MELFELDGVIYKSWPDVRTESEKLENPHITRIITDKDYDTFEEDYNRYRENGYSIKDSIYIAT